MNTEFFTNIEGYVSFINDEHTMGHIVCDEGEFTFFPEGLIDPVNANEHVTFNACFYSGMAVAFQIKNKNLRRVEEFNFGR